MSLSKICCICGNEKALTEFDKSSATVYKPFCKDCRRKRRRDKYAVNNVEIRGKVYAWREKNPDKFRAIVTRSHQKRTASGYDKKLRLSEPGKQAARDAVKHALQTGALVKAERCEMCKSRKKELEAHHDSYLVADRLKVRWLCISCHRRFHRLHKATIYIPPIELFVEGVSDDVIKLAAENYRTKTIPDNLNDDERQVFHNVFAFLRGLNETIVSCSYGNVVKDINAFSVLTYRVFEEEINHE